MESTTWTAIGLLATAEFGGEVSEAVDRLCIEALEARGLIGG